MYSIINGQDLIIKILILILHEKENLSTYHICISFWVFKNSFGTSLTTISIHFYFPFLFLVTLSQLNHLSISSIFVVHFFTHAFQSIFFLYAFQLLCKATYCTLLVLRLNYGKKKFLHIYFTVDFRLNIVFFLILNFTIRLKLI